MESNFWQRHEEQRREAEKDRLNELTLEELLMDAKDILQEMHNAKGEED